MKTFLRCLGALIAFSSPLLVAMTAIYNDLPTVMLVGLGCAGLGLVSVVLVMEGSKG